MAKDSYGQISESFGIPSVEQLITNRHGRFLNRYQCQKDCVCQALKCSLFTTVNDRPMSC